MKLYNKKRAADGWWRVGLGILWIILAIQERENWLNARKQHCIRLLR